MLSLIVVVNKMVVYNNNVRQCIRDIVEQNPKYVNFEVNFKKENKNYTFLQMAAINNDYEMVQYLLDHGADINKKKQKKSNRTSHGTRI